MGGLQDDSRAEKFLLKPGFFFWRTISVVKGTNYFLIIRKFLATRVIIMKPPLILQGENQLS